MELIGDAGRKLHTSRSRNDQVATDLRLWLREAIDQFSATARDTGEALLDLAEKNDDAAMPGYTHLQRAQPILFAHWCLAYFEMLARDRERLTEISQAREHYAARFGCTCRSVICCRSQCRR